MAVSTKSSTHSSSTTFASQSDYVAARKAHAQERRDELAEKRGGIKTLAPGKFDNYRMNPFLIEVEPGYNLRHILNAEADEWLKNDVAKHGVEKPLTIRVTKDGKILLRDGHRRLAAVLAAIDELGAQIDTVPVITEPAGLQDRGAAIAAMFRHNSGEPFHPKDYAKGIQEMLALGWDHDKIATATGFDKAKQKRLLSLLEVSPEILAHVESGMVSMTDAINEFRAAPSEQAAIEKIDARVANAKAKGAKRATAKHDVDRPIPAATTLKNILREIESLGQADKSQKGVVTVAFTAEQYKTLRALAKMS